VDAVAINHQRIREKERQFFHQEHVQSQALLRRGPEAVAEAYNLVCPWCGRRQTPRIVDAGEIHTFFRDKNRLVAIWPDRCGCEEERAGLARERERCHHRRQEFEAQKWIDNLRRVGLSGWLASATFESFTEREEWRGALICKSAVEEYADALLANELGDQPWLIMYGNHGTGKSHLAAAVVHEAMGRGWTRCYFRVWPEYIARLQASWNRQEGEERTRDVVAELQTGNLVVIDDLDKKQPSQSGWAEDELYTVLNHRYNKGLPTVLTFNHRPDDADPLAPGRLALEAYLGRAVLDRVIGAAYDVIEFDGPSFRSGVEW